jgi:hypothetical protein
MSSPMPQNASSASKPTYGGGQSKHNYQRKRKYLVGDRRIDVFVALHNL